MADNLSNVVYIPDTMSNWPWKEKFNPLAGEVEAESTAWLVSLRLYTPESQAAHSKICMDRLAGHVFPDVPNDMFHSIKSHLRCTLNPSPANHLRIGTDIAHMLFVIDEYTDVEPIAGVREISEIILDALCNSDRPCPEGEPMIGEMARQFCVRERALATPAVHKHLLEVFSDYLQGTMEHAKDREMLAIRTVDAYMVARRMDSGVRLCFSPFELHLSIPDHAFYHPVVKELQDTCVDLVLLDNDIACYNREQATCFENWNILSVVMHQYKINLYYATEWVAQYHKVIEARFLNALKCLPSFGPEVDAAVQEYVTAIAAWPRGNYCWMFESERYFGKNGAEVRKAGKAPLLAKRAMDPEMPRKKVRVQVIEELEQV